MASPEVNDKKVAAALILSAVATTLLQLRVVDRGDQ
jgi:hypothetical protein